MRILPQFLFLLIVACISNGCADRGESKEISIKTNEESTKTKRPDVQAKGKPTRKAYTDEELNRPYSTVSPWRYIVTGPETQYFERLLTFSELARVVHGSGNAILVPRDETFKNSSDWKNLLKDENRAALERFVKAHILVGVKSKKSLEGSYVDLNGNTVTIKPDDMGQLKCGGARVLGQEIETDRGLVIPVVGMVENIRWN